MARTRKPAEPSIQPKVFDSVEEIERGIAKLRRRIAEVNDLDPRHVRFDSQEKKNVEDSIHKTILAVFGPGSPEYIDNARHAIRDGAWYIAESDSEAQQKFADGIPKTVTMLEGLIRNLEEEREDFTPSKPAPPEPATSPRATIQIQGGVQNLALGDINEQNVTVVAILTAIADAVEASPDIPVKDKPSILERLRSLASDPWIVSLGSGTILEFIKKAFAGG